MRTRSIVAALLGIICLCALLGMGQADALTSLMPSLTYTVDTTAADPTGAMNACTIAANDCSLVGAINKANAHKPTISPDKIYFDIGIGGAVTISPTQALPTVSDPVIIDGTTQPSVGKVICTSKPCIRLNGVNAGSGSDGLTINASNTTVEGLAIYGFLSGINLSGGSGITVAGNYIGTSDGATRSGNVADDITILGPSNVTVGGTDSASRNLLVAAGRDGVFISSSGGTNHITVEGNYIGTNSAGAANLGNQDGVTTGVPTTTIGGTAGVTPGACTGACNVISGNAQAGVELDVAATVQGNFVGVTPSGTSALGNRLGVHLFYVNDDLLGGTTSSARNVISGNATGVSIEGGVFLGNTYGVNNVVEGNYIGTNAAGTAAVGNGNGIDVSSGAKGTQIGGSAAGAGNLISGNSPGDGIGVEGTDTVIEGNLIGTDASGTAVLDNGIGVEVVDPATGTEIGHGAGAGKNVISGNIVGIDVHSDSGSNSIQNNYIGTDKTGMAALTIGGEGVHIESVSGTTTVGGSAGQGNVISGNGSVGIHVVNTTHTVIQGNIVGLNAVGTAPLGNSQAGIEIAAATTTVGGASGAANVISGNGVGIRINGDVYQASGNMIEGNFVGTNASGDGGLGNLHEGIAIENASGNLIGGANLPDSGPGAAGNVIVDNGGVGVRIDGATAAGNTISANSIDGNASTGIQLDNGANSGQAAPVLTSAVSANGTEITGTLASGASKAYTIEFFASPACDNSGSGEGRDYLGSATVTTNSGGMATIDSTVAGTSGGQSITATATDPDDNTSQFSNCVTVVNQTPTPTPSPTPTPTPTSTPTGQTPTPAGSPTATPSGSATPTPAPPTLGDSNCDGSIDAGDVIADLSDLEGVPPGAPCPDSADVNCDNSVDADDALRIVLYLASVPLQQPPTCPEIGSAM